MPGTRTVNRRRILAWAGSGLAAFGVGAALPRHVLGATQSSGVETPDWSLRVVESNLTRVPDPTLFGGWGYQQGFFLVGQYLVYRRTRDSRLLDYIIGYVNHHVNKSGDLDMPLARLDTIQAGNLLVILHRETGDPRYRLAATKFRRRFDSYPKTTDGGFWHGTEPDLHSQLWLDGTYMAVPFLLRYGRAFHDVAYTENEAVRQLLVYHKHLKSKDRGLLYHAYDESGKAPWVVPGTHRSCCFWCRGMGWYGMTTLATLDLLPHDHPGREPLLKILRELIAGWASYQDPSSGLWYQVVNRPDLKQNWTETSGSCMYTYVIDAAVKRGYVASHYKSIASNGYRGVLARMSLGEHGLTNLSGICVGTNVGDLQSYLSRPRRVNDLHGLGAFLVMNEEWSHSVTPLSPGI